MDGLRAVSILIVLLSHAGPTANFPSSLRQWIAEGEIGVRIFFVISGFLITLLMLKEEGRRGSVSLLAFYRRRCLRILPVFWSYLFFVALLGWVGLIKIDLRDLIQPLTFSVSFPFWKHGVSWVTSHTWSLCIEEHFYLVWPILFVLLSRTGRLTAVSVVLIVGPLLRAWTRIHPRQIWLTYVITGHADMIGWGCLLALIYKYHPALLATIVNWRPDIGRIVAVLVIAKAPYYCLKWFNDYAFAPSISVQAIAIAYLIASLILVPHGVFYWILNHPLVAGIGVISYSLYIWQQVFLFPASSAPTSIFWQRWPANLLCAGIIAVCSYYFIETPMRQLKNRPSRRTAGNAIAALP